jgi:prepilin-type processing-associated H-X9-DG protein
MIGDGRILFCPGFPDSSLFGTSQFSNPSFMSTDGVGQIYGSMMFNPQIVEPTGTNLHRVFQKTSNIIPGRLFGLDCLQIIDIPNGYTSTFPRFASGYFAHYPSHGFNILFTDGSVKFVQSVPAFNYVKSLDGRNPTYAQLYNYLENAP